MSKISDLIAAEARAAETASGDVDSDAPQTAHVSRGNGRSKVLQVRLNEDEYRLIEKLADEAMIPVSTFARASLLKTIGS